MKAMILAAGLGTRLKPWTLSHPKALVPVGGVPMLERVIASLRLQGFDDIVVNVHHFADQIVEFLRDNEIGRDVKISDESGMLLDTGGGILHAEPFLAATLEPFLIHNVDILSNADLSALMKTLADSDADCSLLVSGRDSSRKLLFDRDMNLRGWHNISSGDYRPAGFTPSGAEREFAFSGIHAMRPAVFDEMRRLGFSGPFPVMDFYLNPDNRLRLNGYNSQNLQLIDIGKPETLARANHLFE